MNREQAALYTKIEAQFPGALKTLLPDVPEENYKFIRAFGEGKRVAIITEKGASVFRDKMDFTLCSEDYRICQPKRFCNGVELGECLQPGDELPDEIYVAYPASTQGYEIVISNCIFSDRAIALGVAYATKESAIKHAQAMLIV